MKPRIVALGDSALLVELGAGIDLALNRRVRALDARLRARAPAGVIETAPAYASLVVHYDPLALAYEHVADWVRGELTEIEYEQSGQPRRIEVPVRYGGEDGPDLEFVAASHGLSVSEVTKLHASRDYIVYMMGFTPGYAYMGDLDKAIATPRLETPRTRVRAGSVGIAGEQTGIYPIDSPGGWRIIGRTSLRLFDPEADPPFLFSPGDAVHFVIEALNA